MDGIFSSDSLLNPQLSVQVQAFIRIAFGWLLLGSLTWALPSWKRFFGSERWGGYAKADRVVDFLQNPISTAAIGIIWFSCAIALIVDFHPVVASFLTLLICRYYHVDMRWKGVARGMGAPGLMSYWLAFAVFLLEFSIHFAPMYRSLALLVLQVDFAFIMFSAGVYKASAGYARNHGMEYGMVNPEWGYWWKIFKKLPPGNVLFSIQNHFAWATEVVAAILMVIPQTRFIGGMLILLSFVYIATQIRLALLCEMVIVCCALFFSPGTYGEQFVHLLMPQAASASTAVELPVVASIFGALMVAYLVLMPLAHAGLFYNFYGRKSLPRPLQLGLEKFTNFFGLIIWRVFSVDVVNFFIMIYRKSQLTGERQLVSKYGWQGGFRYNHVCESIAVTSLFTTLKYYASNTDLFNERLLRYARTVPCGADEVLEFEYMSIRKSEHDFQFVPVALYVVDPKSDSVSETILDESVSVKAAHAVSPVHEGVKPGSYVPLGG